MIGDLIGVRLGYSRRKNLLVNIWYFWRRKYFVDLNYNTFHLNIVCRQVKLWCRKQMCRLIFLYCLITKKKCLKKMMMTMNIVKVWHKKRIQFCTLRSVFAWIENFAWYLWKACCTGRCIVNGVFMCLCVQVGNNCRMGNNNSTGMPVH